MSSRHTNILAEIDRIISAKQDFEDELLFCEDELRIAELEEEIDKLEAQENQLINFCEIE